MSEAVWGMATQHMNFPRVRLHEGDDVREARAVEAGVYAGHLIERYGDDGRLGRVVRLGEEARLRLWWVGARIAVLQAQRLASAAALPAEELFQDACLAVADAVRRYDFSRGVRFTTYVYQQVSHALSEASRYREGYACSTRRDRLAARQVWAEADRLLGRQQAFRLDRTAESVGVSPGAATRGLTRVVELDASDLLGEDPNFERVETGSDFLALLSPTHRAVLTLRFGLTGPPRSLSETGRLLGASATTVRRWERQAIDAARTLLGQDRTTVRAPTPRSRRARPGAP